MRPVDSMARLVRSSSCAARARSPHAQVFPSRKYYTLCLPFSLYRYVYRARCLSLFIPPSLPQSLPSCAAATAHKDTEAHGVVRVRDRMHTNVQQFCVSCARTHTPHAHLVHAMHIHARVLHSILGQVTAPIKHTRTRSLAHVRARVCVRARSCTGDHTPQRITRSHPAVESVLYVGACLMCEPIKSRTTAPGVIRAR